MRPDEAGFADQLTALRRQLAALCEQQKTLCDLLVRALPQLKETRPAEPAPHPPAPPAQEVVADCSKDVVRVLREAGHPLTLLEILEQLVHRQLRWRENTVRQAITHLLEEGTLADRQDVRPHSYGVTVR